MEEKKWKINNNEWIGAINLKTNSRYDEDGIDKHGFNKEGIHVITGNQFDEKGYNRFGFNEDGVNKYSIDINGRFVNSTTSGNLVKYIKTLYGRLERIIDILASDEKMYSLYSGKFPILKQKQAERVFDENEIDQYGFNKKGIHVTSNMTTDNEGYNALGYNIDGYDRNGYDFYGFDKYGYDEYGYNLSGRDKPGYDREGYDKQGYNKENIDRYGKKRPEKKLSEDEEKRREENKIQQRKNYLGLKSKAEKLAKGEISLEDYIKSSKTSIEDLIQFAKKEKMGPDVIRGLNKYIKPYRVYKKPFSKKEYLNSTTLIIDGNEVKPTEEDVDRCVEYLKAMDSLICDKTVRDTVRKFLRGEIDITIEELQDSMEENEEETKKALSEIIICQQSKIKSQEFEITKLKVQRRSLDEQ